MSRNKKKIIRAVTVSMSVVFFKDLLPVLKRKGFEVVVLSSPGKEMEELKENGTATIVVPMERPIFVKRDFMALMALCLSSE